MEPISILDSGAEGRTRTADTYIFSVVLYQLSYLGTPAFYRWPLKPGKLRGR